MDILLAPHNLPFSIALALMAIGALLQIVASGVSDAVDVFDGDATPDVGDLDAGNAISGALGWLGVGTMPFFMLLSLFFALFGLIGLFLQTQMIARTGAALPTLLASLAALGATIPALKISGLILRPILPRDETEAVSPDSFLGRQATIEVGVARHNRPAQARLQDSFGHFHYIQVEPQNVADEFAAGATVLVVARREHLFLVVEGVAEAKP